MMKNIFSIAVLLAASAMVLTGCKNEEDDLFSSSAAERLSESQVTYAKRLGGTAWVMEYYPLGTFELDPETRDPYPAGLGYVILNRFKADGSVEQAMQNAVSLNYYINDTSLWQIISDQGPVLSFNTFNNCIHVFSDPGVNNSTMNLYQGRGYEGDYEFAVLDMKENADVVMLKGKKRGAYIRMVKLPYDTDFQAYLKDLNAFKDKIFSADAPNNALAFLGDTTFVMTKASKGIAEFYPVGGDVITQSTDHVFTLTQRNGKYYMRFLYNIGRSKCDAREFVYNEAEDRFTCLENGSYVIEGYPVAKFYNEYLQKKKWTTKVGAEMSSSFKDLMDKLAAELKAVNKNFVLSNINFGYDSKLQKYVWTMSYLSSGKVANQAYYFTFDCNEDKDIATFKFVEPSNTAAQNVMNRCPTLKTIWDTISQEMQLSAADSRFNLQRIKLTSKTNSDIWFVMNI